MDHPLFDHEGPWTEDAYLALPGRDRVEVVDGTLLVGPGTSARRAEVVTRVRETVAAALPKGLRVLGPVKLRLGPDCILMPDLIVTRVDQPEGRVLDAVAALMVIEVVGREHGAADRTFKPQLYARSRIPYSVLIDHDSPFAVADMILGGRYHEYSRAVDGAPFRIEEPFLLEMDVAAVASPARAEAAPRR